MHLPIPTGRSFWTTRRFFFVPMALWLIITLAYQFGADGVSFGRRFGNARIDFSRKYDRVVLLAADGYGFQLTSAQGLPELELVRIQDAPVGLCWVCGANRVSGALVQNANYRAGDWIYRAPAPEPNLTGWAPSGVAIWRRLAWNVRTGEQLQSPPAASLDAQSAVLATRGLVVSPARRLGSAEALDARPLSMMYEGCVVVQAAFTIFNAAWLLAWGVGYLIVRRRAQSAR
jgi:hypothetical protein